MWRDRRLLVLVFTAVFASGFVAGLLVAKHLSCNDSCSMHAVAKTGRGHDLASIVETIRSLLVRGPSSTVRDQALRALVDYASRRSILVNESVELVPGWRQCVGLKLYKGIVYWFSVDATGGGSVDVYLVIGGREEYLGEAAPGRGLSEHLVPRSIIDASLCLLNNGSEKALVRVAVSASLPRNITNDPVYKVLAIALWARDNLRYVSDPRGLEYVASPDETLKTMSGDCDDFAVLLASMYRAVGLRAGVALVDTSGDHVPDHASVLVALPPDKEELSARMAALLQALGVPFDGFTSISRGNTTWLVIDPAMAYNGTEPWLVTLPDYEVVGFVEPG
ncbi:transglutaminase-like domain-containing protein [Pyrofollis japonicus]|uniref:transglutaminase-like domain-containing protein n=1 Tax=Pyrofollis japonicus TaxID=3060460 RepID=UPI00295A6831|nr:transglutaminase-like domain-containing protein [Pyrofollis japonicus]